MTKKNNYVLFIRLGVLLCCTRSFCMDDRDATCESVFVDVVKGHISRPDNSSNLKLVFLYFIVNMKLRLFYKCCLNKLNKLEKKNLHLSRNLPEWLLKWFCSSKIKLGKKFGMYMGRKINVRMQEYLSCMITLDQHWNFWELWSWEVKMRYDNL